MAIEQGQKRLTSAIQKDLKEKEKKAAAANGDENLSDLQRLLLQGPVMTDEQFNKFKAVRKSFKIQKEEKATENY